MSGSGLRLAGNALKGLLIPRTAAGNVDKLALGMRYLPDLMGAGISAAIMPEGATVADRFGAGAEDLGISLLASLAGQGLGRGAARLAGKNITPELKENLTTIGDMVVGYPAAVVAPRPIAEGVLNRVYQQEYEKAAQQKAAVQEAQQQMTESQAQQELIALLMNAGAYGGRALS